jgi:hypothetical protein
MDRHKDKEMTAETWREEIASLLKQISPERRAYLIISNFFNTNNLTEKTCEEFKAWFIGNDRNNGKQEGR